MLSFSGDPAEADIQRLSAGGVKPSKYELQLSALNPKNLALREQGLRPNNLALCTR